MIAVFPIYWMLITAFKQDPDLYRMENIPFWFNMAPTLKHFKILFFQTNYGALDRQHHDDLGLGRADHARDGGAGRATRWPGFGFRAPRTPGIGDLHDLSGARRSSSSCRSRGSWRSLGLQDSWWALVVVYPTFTIPFCTWLLMGFFKTVPMEMEEAARVDGCGYLGAFLRVVLPVSVPGVLTSVIFAFTLSMQDFLYGLAFVAPGDQKPVPVGVPTELIRGDVYYWGSLMARGVDGGPSGRACSTTSSSTGSSRASPAGSGK